MPDDWDTEDTTEEANVPRAKQGEQKFSDLSFGTELIVDLPTVASSLYTDAVGKLIELTAQAETGGWMPIKTGGREPNSVQTGLQAAARKLGVKIKTRTRTIDGEKMVYVALQGDNE